MREVLQRRLSLSGDAALRVRNCHIANTRRRDGSRGTVEYELRLEDASSGRVWNQRVTGITFGGDRTRRVWESLHQSEASGAASGRSGSLAAFEYVPELDLLLQVFPHDYRLPALAKLMAGPPPELIPVLLAEFGGETQRLVGWNAEPVQYRVDMRAILRISVQTQNHDAIPAERQFYAKIYRDAADCRRAFETQRAVSTRAAETSETLIAAPAVAHLDEMHTMVTAALSGISLSRIVRRGDDFIPAVRAAARATAEFHNLAVPAPPRPVAEDASRLKEAEAFLVSERPDLADAVSTMVQTVIDGLDGAPAALIHGDLKPDHFLVDGDRVALLDFDLVATADPVADVAHLLAFLGKPQDRARARREHEVDAADMFAEEYFEHAPPSWRERLPFYHAMTSIHKAVGLCRRRGADGQARLADVLREGQGILGQGELASVPSFKRRMTRSAARAR